VAVIPDIDPILDRYPGAGRDALIPILQDVQERHGYLSEEAVVRIGEHLGLPSSKIYGVATFYNQFRFRPKGRYHIQVCRGTACHVKGSLAVLEAVKRELRLEPGQTTRDARPVSLPADPATNSAATEPISDRPPAIFKPARK